MAPIALATAVSTASQADTLVLAVAFTLLLPALPFALYRLVPFLTHHHSSLQTAQDAALALSTAVALALYAITALVALSGTGSWTAAVASGAFGCLSVTLRNLTLLLSIARPPTLPLGAVGQDCVAAAVCRRLCLSSCTLFLLVALCTHVPLLALLPHAVLVTLAATRASFSVLFAVGLVALVAVTLVQDKTERSRSRSWEFAEGTSMDNAESLPSRSRQIRLLVILVSSIILDILSVAFAIREPYPRLPSSLPAARSGTLAPTLLGTTTSRAVAYLVIALFAAAQSILLTESVRAYSCEVTLSRAPPRSTNSFESSFVEITLPPPSLPPRQNRSPPHGRNSDYPKSVHTHDYASTPPASLFTTPVRANPTLTRELKNSLPSGAHASSTPTPRSHRSLPPLTIGANFTPVSQGFKGRCHLTPTLLARPSTASTTASLPRPSTASTTRSYRNFDDHTAAGSGHRPPGSATSSSPTQYRRGSQFSFRRGRSGSYSSSIGRISGVPSLTRLSTIFNGGGAVTTSMGKGSSSATSPTTPTRRRSSSVGSLLRSVVPGGAPTSVFATSTTDQLTSPPEWDVEPNEAHDDPFARPPPTPSEPTSTSTPAPSATPTRAETPGGAGSLAPSRLVRALEAIKEPENGSPPNPASSVEEGQNHDDDEEDARPSSEGDHLERVLTPTAFPFSLEEQRARPTRSRSDSAASSLFHEHVGASPPPLATPTVTSGFGLDQTTPFAVETRGRNPPDSPPRKRTETRPAAPSDFASRLGDVGATPTSPTGTSDSLATPRNRSSSLRLLASSIASSGSARLVTLRRIRSSLRRRSPSPSPRGTNERPSESSELSFSCRGAEASLPDLHGDADHQIPSSEDAKSMIRPATPSRPVGLTPPPVSVRLSVASRKAWWKHLSAASQTSFSLAGSDSLPQQAGTPSDPVSRSSWYLERGRMTDREKFAAVNARWSGYQLPPLDAVSPLSSSLFLPEGARRSDSRERKSFLRRTKSSPAMIDPLPGGAEATMMSFAASSKFSSASFVTARSAAIGQAFLSDPTLGIELDELNHLVDTFVPLPVRDAIGSAPSSAALTPLSPLFGSPLTNSVNGDDYDLVSPITPATPSGSVGVARKLTGESNGQENVSV